MGCCLSKTTDPSSSSQKCLYKQEEPQTSTNQLEIQTKKIASSETEWKKKSKEEEEKKNKRAVVGKGTAAAEDDTSSLPTKRPVFVVQHRKTDEPNFSSSASDVSTPPNSEKNPKSEAAAAANIMAMAANGAVVRTSSCTKEEVDAILIQCGRLSRSSSGKGGGGTTNVSAASGRKYSGSKRSHDFDRENEATTELSSDSNWVVALHDNKDNDNDNYNDERQRRRQSRGSHRRRTPSRSRERADQQQSRSGSKERAVGNRRRVSRSPGRRSESPITSSASDVNTANNNGNHTSCGASSSGNNIGKPGKMVSVPATVSSLSVEKTNNAGDGATATKRVLVKRNAGGGGGGDGSLRSIASPRSRSPARSNVAGSSGAKSCSAPTEVECSVAAGSRAVASPRSRSPARVGSSNGVKGGGVGISEVGNNNGQQIQGSLTRNSSRKAEHSPYRRTPLNELDMNSLPFQPLVNNNKQKKSKEVVVEEEASALVVNRQPLGMASQSKSYADINSAPTTKAGFQGAHRRTRSRGGGEGPDAMHINYCRVNENQPKCVELPDDRKDNQLKSSKYDTAVNNPTATSGPDNSLKVPQTMTRSRSSRRSRDLDINVDSLLSPHPTTANYNSLLLQDIRNFHQNGNASGNFNTTTNSKTNLSLTPNTPFTLPASVGKACSILEAVADLNSSTNSNLSSNFFDDREHTPSTELLSSKNMSSYSSYANKGSKDPFLVSEVRAGGDDPLQQPSLHKYVTVRKRGAGENVENDFEKVESCGSNSFTGSQYQHWVSPSSWEPNSADSSDCWTSKSRDVSPLGLQRLSLAQNGSLVNGESQKKLLSSQGKEPAVNNQPR